MVFKFPSTPNLSLITLYSFSFSPGDFLSDLTLGLVESSLDHLSAGEFSRINNPKRATSLLDPGAPQLVQQWGGSESCGQLSHLPAWPAAKAF